MAPLPRRSSGSQLRWRSSPPRRGPPPRRLRRPPPCSRRLALLTSGVVYLQIVFGAFLTHFGARLDGHLAGAAALALLIPVLALRVQRGQGDQPALVLPARLLVALLVGPLLLGLGAR